MASGTASPWPPVPQIVLAVLGVVVIGALIFGVVSAGGAFGVFNPTWEGTSELRTGVEHGANSEVQLSMAGYDTTAPSETIIIIISPTERYASDEIAQIQQFVLDGGTVVVADNFGPHSNPLLGDVGASARLDSALLRDEIEYAAAPTFPIATGVNPHPYTTNVEELTLNHGTAITPQDATVLVETSSFAYLDQTQTGNLTDDDELGPHPVVTVESIGAGQVITVADPSIFINTMLSEPDNEAFATALISAHDRLVLDYSHRELTSPVAIGLIQLRQTPLIQALLGSIGVSIVLVLARGGPGNLRVHVRTDTIRTLRRRIANLNRIPTRLTAVVAPPPRDGEPPLNKPKRAQSAQPAQPTEEDNSSQSRETAPEEHARTDQ